MLEILRSATDALALLDADELVKLERRALDLQALLAGETLLATPELRARFRVFAAVVESTRENLCVLDRTSNGGYGAATPGNPWAR